MDPEIILTNLNDELKRTFKLFSKSKTVDDKLKYSQIIKNLCDSAEVFFNLANNMLPLALEEAFSEMDGDFEDGLDNPFS